MEIFHNLDRPNYDEIISYGPKWLTEYYEMNANYRYAGWTLDLMAYWLERTVQNVFPLHADEETTVKSEKFLGIEFDSSATLEERRKVVAAYYFFGYGKLSKSVIINLIKVYTGCDSELSYDGKAFLSEIDGSKMPVLLNDKILYIITRRLPSHLGYSVDIKEKIQVTEYCGITQVMTPHIVIEM